MLCDFTVRTDHEIEAETGFINYQQRSRQLPNNRRGNSKRWKGESKRRRKSTKIPRSREINSKDVGYTDTEGDIHRGGALGTMPLRLE